MKIGLRTGQNPSNFSHFEGKFASKSAQSPSKSRFLGNPPDLQNRALMNKGAFLNRGGVLKGMGLIEREQQNDFKMLQLELSCMTVMNIRDKCPIKKLNG